MRLRRIGNAILSAALWLTLTAPASAQLFHVRSYTEAEGLPSSNVMAISQDSSGRMWFATRSGLATYDGLEWEMHCLLCPLREAEDAYVRFDGETRLWVVGRELPVRMHGFAGTGCYDLPEPPPAAKGTRVTSVAAERATGDVLVALATNEKEILLWNGREWLYVAVVPFGESARISALAVSHGQVYIGTSEGLLTFQGDEGAKSLASVKALRGKAILGLAFDVRGGFLWVVGRNWLGRLEGEELVTVDPELDLRPGLQASELVVTPDGEGGVFLSDHLKVLVHKPGLAVERLGVENGLISRGIHALYRDREGILWVGTSRGVTKVVSLRFASYRQAHGLLGDEVTAILERRSGEFVLGNAGGLSFMERGRIRTLEFGVSESPVRVLDLAEDPDGTLWVVTEDGGLAEITGRNRVAWRSDVPGLARGVLADRAGRLWLVTSTGLYVLRSRGFGPVELPPSLDEDELRGLYEGPGGALFVATLSSGLHRLDDDGWRSWDRSQERGARNVFAVLEQPDGKIWVGTAAGLCVAEEGELKTVGTGPRVVRPVYFLTRDRAERLWIGTDNGVMRWNGESLRHFTVSDGLVGRASNQGAGLVDAHNRVWIGTEAGVSIYRPQWDPPRLVPPSVGLDTLDAEGQQFALDRPVELAHGQNTILFRFRAISFTDETQVLVKSWLEGFEEDWLAPYEAPRRERRYTNLPSGEYRFHVQAASVDGAWSEVVSSAPIVIRGPLWTQAWFIALGVVFLAAGAYALQRYYTRGRYARRLEAEVEAKIGDLRQSEEKLRQIEEAERRRLEVTLSSIADGVVAAGSDGRVLLINPTAAKLTGWDAEEAVGRPVTEVLPLTRANDEGVALDPAGHILREQEPLDINVPLKMTKRDGGSRLLEISGAAMRGDGAEPKGVVLAFRDITEKRRIEGEMERTERLQSLGVLAGGIAHDFNNLMAVVLGNLSLLRLEKEVGPDTARRLDDAEAALLRARDLTQQLLTFSKGGAPVREAAEIREVIEESGAFALHGSNVRFVLDLPADLWVVEIDSGQVSQVIQNILLNANQAMPEGGAVRITGRNLAVAPPSLPSGRYVEIAIADEGTGISPENLDRIFDPYFTTNPQGSGLGLTSAYSIVKRHDGLLTAESRLGEGTTFHIFLPASAEKKPRERARQPAVVRGAGNRILIMDDEEGVRAVMSAQLQTLGYSTECAVDGEEAIRRYRDAAERGERFDVVILDLTVRGGMGGRETIKRLQAIDPAVKAIVVSGFSNDPVMADHEAHGFRGRVSKPFETAELAAALREVIQEGGTS
jgi:PAS domain S-box-containing protein